MGASFSCSFAEFDDLDSQIEAVLLRSISFGGVNSKDGLLRSVSFNGRESEPATTRLKSYGSAKFVLEGSLSFKGRRELEKMLSFKTPTASFENNVFGRTTSSKMRDFDDQLSKLDTLSEEKSPSPVVEQEPGNKRYQAALKLQKVYKSFRTRRRLADCAVLVEQRWWKLLDFAELKRSSISFFDIEKHETAVSRWSRARTRAAKVGKGLSKDEKARKLALQHWLEAIDPRHRYGHNLQFYYARWLHCESRQPFFYWLDIGDGKEENLERCPRSKLQQQCIKYLGPAERESYEIAIEDGKFIYKQSAKLLDTRGGPKDAKWIFVLGTSKTLYVGMKNKGTFQHSSFLAGGATLSAGRLVVEDGILKAVWPHSGHYLPTEENFQEFMSFLEEHNVDLTNVKKSPSDEEDTGLLSKKSSLSKPASIKDTGTMDSENSGQQNTDLTCQDSNAAENHNPLMSRLPRNLCSKITKLEIPNRKDLVFDIFKKDSLPPSCHGDHRHHLNSPAEESGYETAEESFLTEEDFMFPKSNLFDDEDQEEEDEKPIIPKEKIMKRIDSHKGMKSYQLAQHLSTRWSTGAGPRIGCMRDYPSELQFRVLEQANLSPRSKGPYASPRNLSRFSQRVLKSPTSLGIEPANAITKSTI
ncbi:calmodulin-binding family protein [Trema orientale]|uniref:Calmodulin-binding family protein n=1 Tax=Trema orientale TaxID=63057 RepID=A0A2P5EA28_TREOI|nr:calmodulin-binding family protein [Trema orientale]